MKSNNKIYDRLSRISQSRSRYATRTEGSTDSLLHHNYHYDFIRREKEKYKNNEMLGTRILKVSSNLSQKKDAKDFQTIRQNSSRLSKFDQYKRMNRLISNVLDRKGKFYPKTFKRKI